MRHDYRYAALGRRIEKITDVYGTPTTVRYSYGGNFQQVVEEQDENGLTLATYVYGNGVDEVLSMRRHVGGTNEDHYYHADDMGNVGGRHRRRRGRRRAL